MIGIRLPAGWTSEAAFRRKCIENRKLGLCGCSRPLRRRGSSKCESCWQKHKQANHAARDQLRSDPLRCKRCTKCLLPEELERRTCASCVEWQRARDERRAVDFDHCRTCRATLPSGGVVRLRLCARCRETDNARRRKVRSKRAKPCRGCGEPFTSRDFRYRYCQPCVVAGGRECRRCHQRITSENICRSSSYCAECWPRVNAWRVAKRRGFSWRVICRCGAAFESSDLRVIYCAACREKERKCKRCKKPITPANRSARSFWSCEPCRQKNNARARAKSRVVGEPKA